MLLRLGEHAPPKLSVRLGAETLSDSMCDGNVLCAHSSAGKGTRCPIELLYGLLSMMVKGEWALGHIVWTITSLPGSIEHVLWLLARGP